MKKIIKYIIDIFMKIDYFFKQKEYKKIKILSTINTINEINEKKLSVCRFGDGEFKWILGINKNTFQKNNDKLKDRLIEVLMSKNNNALICVPRVLIDMKENNYSSKRYWRLFLFRYYKLIKKYLSSDYVYGNASFTRPYIALKNKKNSKIYFDAIKGMWDGKDLTIIEGINTRLGVGNDLLDNANSIERILCPSSNAFDIYDKILEEALKVDNNRLVIIALGPTATVLAYDLSKYNYQAIDIGHIDIEYEWYINKSKRKVNVLGKAVNEVNSKNDIVEYVKDEKYEASIIKIVK